MLDSDIDQPVRDGPRAPLLRRRRVQVLLGGAAVLAVGSVGAALALRDGGGSASGKTSTLPTVAVVRADVTNTTDVDGTLGYAESYTVLAGGKGRVTWVPKAGDVIERGKRAYGVDGHRVPLLYGRTPFWRDMEQGTKGYDVLELERNLDALGYGDDMTVDRSFTWATEQAVIDWQDDLGLSETGVVKADDVVVQPGAIRVTKLQVLLGGSARGALYTASSTRRLITVNLPVSQQEIVRKGAKARVTLPGGKTTTGRVSSIGSVATAGSTNSQSQAGQGTETATIPVYVTLDDKGGAGGLDGAPATVGFSSTEHKNVLTVPINALLAHADNKYAVAVVDASGNVREVPVKLGIFDGDNVEVSGDLTAGAKVQVPKS
ncbi:peptidoglycan-binding protein [Actinomadura graeca]|uniref:Peptidoglycan-binding protein n=1 Tax=Actinomadura graeca TaxID=2750812 RepID=A0ABX8QRL1_9ACTN|nr:peptidoglycan-binding protein [Actinomadura graeca]QXJ21449.1 peptidoglycan-binding protein [Actinomadura graeca]